MKELQLTNTNRVAQVSDSDYARLSRYPWYLHDNGRVVRMDKGIKKLQFYGWVPKRLTVYLHREIMRMEPDDNRIVVHADGDFLNNRRENLRVCQRTELWPKNTQKRRQATSRFRGVSRSKCGWVARITIDRDCKYLGHFPPECEIKAAQAYDLAAITYRKNSAVLNFSDSIHRNAGFGPKSKRLLNSAKADGAVNG